MSDHLNYCTTTAGLSDTIDTNDWNDSDESANINIETKNDDELLIELYRERPFLYDKSNVNFKDALMKQNTWIEISKIMIETNCGECSSLRDQYNKEKKRLKLNSEVEVLLLKLFDFLFFIVSILRLSYTNCIKSQLNIIDENSSTCESQSIASISSNEENENTDKQHIHNMKYFNKENLEPKMKKRKLNETKELEQTLIRQQIMLSLNLKAQFNSIPEKEKNIRRKMIMDALTEPLSEKKDFINQKVSYCKKLYTYFMLLIVSTFCLFLYHFIL
ncbi:hypothetical protein P5V15_003040 [Pogonomyrmex californicus]